MEHEWMSEAMVTELDEEIKRVVKESEEAAEGGGERLHRMEEGVRQAMNRMSGRLLKEYLERTESKDRGPRACEPCGQRMRNVKRAELTVQSVFGALTVRRTHYYCEGCRRSSYPMDEQYGWQPHRFTPLAKEWVCLFTQAQAYEEAVKMLGRVSGILGTVESYREVTHECGQWMLEERARQVRQIVETVQPYAKVSAPSSVMLVGADGCQILKSGEQVGRPKKGEKRRKKRHRGRQGKDRRVGNELRDRGMEAKVGMIAALKLNAQNEYELEQTSYLATMEKVDVFEDWLFSHMVERGVLQADQVVVMGDGASWIWKRIAPCVPLAQRIEIVDWYHLREKVWETGEILYGPRDRWPTGNWVDQQLEKLWQGNVEGVRRALRLQQQKWEAKATGNERALEAIHNLTHYLEENQSRMDYPRYRRLRLPIGSGPVESACKRLVGARMKCSGMQWRKQSAAPILQLRADFLSGRWDETWRRLRAAA
jgi:hypothetical protein